MRVVIVPWPARGDVLPLVTVATALRDRGHEVVFAGADDVGRVVEPRGFRFEGLPEVGRGGSVAGGGALRYLTADLPDEVAALDRLVDRLEPDVLLDGDMPLGPRLVAERRNLRHGSVCANVIPQLDPTAATLLSLASSAAGGDGPLATWWRDQGAASADELAAWNAVRASLGLDVAHVHPWLEWPSSQLVIVPSTDALLRDAADLPAHAHYVGPLLLGEDVPMPPQLSDAGSRPRVLVCQGTFFHGGLDILRRVSHALAGTEIDLVASTGGADPAVVAADAPNLELHRYLPFGPVVAAVDAVVCHGGFGTVNWALAAGRPLVVLPLGADHGAVAGRCEATGAGIRLDVDADDDAILAAVRAVLEAPGHRRAAEVVARSYQEHDGPQEAALLVERLGSEPGPREPTFEERMFVMDSIVGRCIRDRAFAEAVLADPDRALEGLGLNEGELEDFRALALGAVAARALGAPRLGTSEGARVIERVRA